MNLITQDDGGGQRHFLDGRPVSCGTQLRLKINSNVWAWARYEATFRKDGIFPVLYTTFGLVIPDEETFLRWPTQEEQ